MTVLTSQFFPRRRDPILDSAQGRIHAHLPRVLAISRLRLYSSLPAHRYRARGRLDGKSLTIYGLEGFPVTDSALHRQFLNVNNSAAALQYRIFAIFFVSVLPGILLSVIEPNFIMAVRIYYPAPVWLTS